MQVWQRQSAQGTLCALRRNTFACDRLGIRGVASSATTKQEHRFKSRRREDDEDGERVQRDRSRNANPPRMNDSQGVKVRRLLFDSTRDNDHRSRSRYNETKRPGGVLLKDDGKPLVRRASATELSAGGFSRKRELEAVQVRPIAVDHLNQSLARLESSMRTYKPDGQKKSQMQLWDPEGTKWAPFQRFLKNLHTRASSGLQTPLSAKDRALWTTLSIAHADGKSELERQLSFAFMDFTLESVDQNLTTLEQNPLMDLRFPTEWYSPARKTQRTIHLHVGPTNSGKTYNALKRLQEAKDGFYAGPLRLLAHEVYSRFRANGIACDLVTGDDIRYDDASDTKVYASTVEMVDCSRQVEVAVIDEIQMLGHEERGWAWTRAFLGANAKEVHLCGEERVVPLIRELAASMGDTLQVHKYQRLNPLKCMPKSLRGNLKALRKGDCIVAFSVMHIHELKKQIEVETGKRCAIVYGSLPPETRAEQADLFNNPDNDYDYLVASDAIGMGLNLAVKRIIFNKVTRFDGTKSVLLSVPQIKQIAGRAGRYRSAHQDKQKVSAATPDISTVKTDEETVGWVTTLDEADLPIVSRALSTEAPPLTKAGLNPPAEFLEDFNNKLPLGTPFEYLIRAVHRVAETHPRFFLCDVRDRLLGARIIEDVTDLTIEQRVNLCAAPIGGRNVSLAKCFKALARVISKLKPVTVADISEIPLEVLAQEPTANRNYLSSLEDLHKCLIMYLWLSYRFPQTLRNQPMAVHAKELTEQKINWTLRTFSANPLLARRLQKLRNTQPATDGSLAAETAQYLEAMKQLEAQQEIQPAVGEQTAGAEVPVASENPIQELIEDETFDEHFAEPAEAVTVQQSSEKVDEAETLEVEAKEQMVEVMDEQPPAVGATFAEGDLQEGHVESQLSEEPTLVDSSEGEETIASMEHETGEQKASSGSG